MNTRPNLNCLSCQQEWPQEEFHSKCPKCGGDSFGISFDLKVSVGLSMAAEGINLGGETVIKARAQREYTKTGETAGTQAWVEQMVDKSTKPGKYKKKVILSNGEVAKDVYGLLTDQSLHGPQN